MATCASLTVLMVEGFSVFFLFNAMSRFILFRFDNNDGGVERTCLAERLHSPTLCERVATILTSANEPRGILWHNLTDRCRPEPCRAQNNANTVESGKVGKLQIESGCS